ncbi:autotransporter outer membrane beta-barrel domain-containing protein [Parachlamydia acanthamoebae]|uniref:autotransporter outer membrane beta-barrel domain-containing protein n=1 Tax=Parachlamydia acanthamoebae TaxID=83552 RepID=UPI00138DE1B3|nr:autotransporter outer membrane beta-barrel domain-containing protein [Parachlamydia acanthamoebae]
MDTWLQQGWYRNTINGHGLPQENYRSRSLTTSLELGYGLTLGQSAARHWVIEPQGQLTHIHYRSNDITEKNGTRISKVSEHNVLKRLGMRVSSRPADKVGGLQPFVEVNWLHGQHANTLSFGGTQVANDVPKNRIQLKAGVQGTFSKSWQLWGHIGGERGKNKFSSYEGNIGLKHVW